MTTQQLFYLMALQHVPNLGDSTAKKLIRKLGSAQAIFEEKKQNLLKIDGIGLVKIKELYDANHFRAAENEIKFIEKHHINYTGYQEESYPEKLKHCLDGPILLFSRGNINLENQKIISIVGTRKITAHGAAFIEQFVEDLGVLNPIIVSGLAYGVDIHAHKCAIKNRLQTIACLAHGLNQIYPKVHKRYISEIEENGGLFTDFWSTDTFDRNNFLKRNRIIAGLSEATIVVESAEKGGSLVTADIANSYNREVFAVPGRPGDSLSRGTNDLIKTQKAQLLNSAADLIYMLNWNLEERNAPIQKQLFVEMNEEERSVVDFLNKEGKSQLDQIALNCNFPTFKTASLLLNMELKGLIRPLPGKLFELI